MMVIACCLHMSLCVSKMTNIMLLVGVLGGFGVVTPVDIKESNEFLDKVLELRPQLQLNRVAGNY